LILSLLPRPPQRIDAATIEARLRERGHVIHRRTIQRDLVELASVFPIVADERSKPYGWRWSEAHARGPVPLHPLVVREASQMRVTLAVKPALMTEVCELLRLGGVERLSAKSALLVDVAGTVDDSLRTRRVLLAYGTEVEVVEPHQLREEIRVRAQEIAVRFAK